MKPDLGRQIARQIESQQVALLRQESARRQKLAIPRAQVLTYRDGAVYNQGSNGSLTPTRLITNRGIPEGGSVARKGGGASDASPYFRRRGLTSGGIDQDSRKRFALRLEVKFLDYMFELGNESLELSDADQLETLGSSAIQILNPPEGLNDPFSFLIPLNTAQAQFTRSPFNDPDYSYEKAGFSGFYFNRYDQAPQWRGGRMAGDTELLQEPPNIPFVQEWRLANENTLGQRDSSLGFGIKRGGLDEIGIIPERIVEFRDLQVLGIQRSEFRLPDYRVTGPSREPFERVATTLLISKGEVIQIGN